MMTATEFAFPLAPRIMVRPWAPDRSQSPSDRRPTADSSADAPTDAFADLASLVASNDLHMEELAALNARLASVNAYMAEPGANLVLAGAYLNRIRLRRSRVLTVLRANRIAAREFLSA